MSSYLVKLWIDVPDDARDDPNPDCASALHSDVRRAIRDHLRMVADLTYSEATKIDNDGRPA